MASTPRTEAEAVEHLRDADTVLGEIIDRVGTDGLNSYSLGSSSDHYGALVRTIVGQQLSTKAAEAIYGRLIAQFGGRNPTPEEVLAADPDEMRTAAGLSHAKVRYLRSLAERVLDGSLELDTLGRLPDSEVVAQLVAVTGLGRWSADMFLMFHLGRPDVVAVGDLGIRQAIKLAYGFDDLPSPAEIEPLAEPWRPYRTLACLFLWRSLGATPPV